MVDHNDDKGLDIEPEAPPAAAAPAADQAQADAAQTTTPAEQAGQAPEGADTMARTKKTTAAPRARKAAAAKAPAKPKAAAAGKAAGTTAAPAPKKERDPLAGIRDKPKLPGVLLGAEISRKVVLKALKALDPAKLHDDSERREVARLVARIEARG